MKISVVIPLYNKSETILRALNSIFTQTVQPEEIIVVNDGSTDDSEAIVSGLNHPLVRLISQTNAGVSAARNRGIAVAKSEWIAFLDADDEWLAEFLETITMLSEKYPQCSLLATSYFFQDSEGIKDNIVLRKLPFTGEDGVLGNYFEVAAYSNPPLWSSAIVVSKNAIKEIGGFPTGITSGEDLLTWTRLAIRNSIAFSVHPLAAFIKDTTLPSRMPETPDFVGAELYNLLLQYKIPFLRQYISVWHKMRAKSFLMLNQKRNAFNEIRTSITMNLTTKAWYFLPFLLLPHEFFKRASRIYSRYLSN
jgi:glycosyltransferase involved in cell wall biosynthesis